MPTCFVLTPLSTKQLQPHDQMHPAQWLDLVEKLNSLRSALLELRRAWAQTPHQIAIQEARLVELQAKCDHPTSEEYDTASERITDLRAERADIDREVAQGAAGGHLRFLQSRRDGLNAEIHRLEGAFRGHLAFHTAQEIRAKMGLARSEIDYLIEKRAELELRGWMVQQALQAALNELCEKPDPKP